MKTILLLSFLLLLNFLCYSQDFEPTQIPFKFRSSDTTYYISGDSGYFKINEPLLGWHWDLDKIVTKSMQMNQSHQTEGTSPLSLIADSAYVIKGVEQISTNGSVKTAMNSMSMIYEPTLRITNPGILETRNGDTTNPIWGFREIDVANTDALFFSN